MSNCQNCNLSISEEAEMCPACGHPAIAKRRKDLAKRIRNMSLVWIVIMFLCILTGTYPISGFSLFPIIVAFIAILSKDLIAYRMIKS